jgi:hypothetical protein
MTIATDRVDTELVEQLRRWDIRFIRNFMMTFGLVSSIFDYLTIAVLLRLQDAGGRVSHGLVPGVGRVRVVDRARVPDPQALLPEPAGPASAQSHRDRRRSHSPSSLHAVRRDLRICAHASVDCPGAGGDCGALRCRCGDGEEGLLPQGTALKAGTEARQRLRGSPLVYARFDRQHAVLTFHSSEGEAETNHRSFRSNNAHDRVLRDFARRVAGVVSLRFELVSVGEGEEPL